MGLSLWLAILTIAIGTYMMRLLPMLWMQRHLKKHSDKDAMDVIPQWLTLLGPLMIAAMLGVSLVPKTPDINAWLATIIGCIATWLTWRHTRSLGLPVALGVSVFGLTSFVLQSFMPVIGN